jgi:prolipoprotein diacylglyceryltransferase
VAQGIGRIGNYFNKELFGRPTTLPWGLEIPYQYRVSGGIPARYLNAATFQPTFLYELIFDVAWAGVLIWLGHHRKIKPPGVFALYVFGYSAYRIFEESLRVDSSVYIFGLRLNTYIASVLTVVGAVWFYRTQRRPARTYTARPASATEPATRAEPAANAGAPRSADAGADDSAPPDDAAPGDSPEAGTQPSRDSEQATS